MGWQSLYYFKLINITSQCNKIKTKQIQTKTFKQILMDNASFLQHYRQKRMVQF